MEIAVPASELQVVQKPATVIAATERPTPARIPALDGIRGLAVLMVLLFHYHQGMLPLTGTWTNRFLGVLNLTQTGVDLFFVLSGFLITGILLDAKGSPGFLRNFYMRRALRILPLYYLLVVGYLIAGWVGGNPAHAFGRVWWYLLYLQNVGTTFWPQAVGEPGHFWSLGVEEHFYLILPLLILVCRERALPRILLALVAVAMASRILLLALGFDVFTFSLCRMDALGWGALLAVARRRPEMERMTSVTCLWGLVIFGLALPVCYLLTSGKAFAGMQVAKYSLIALFYAALIGTVTGPSSNTGFRWLFENRFLRWCGRYSYAMYVFHPLAYYWTMRCLRPNVPSLRSHPAAFMAGEFAVCVLATFLIGWLSWHLFEKHFLDLKRFFEYRPATAN